MSNDQKSMVPDKEYWTKYETENNLIITRLKGEIILGDTIQWVSGLNECINDNCGGKAFRVLIDTFDYYPQTEEAHELFRKTLIEDEALNANIIVMGFVHHNAPRMEELNKRSIDKEGYFDDYERAYRWVKQYISPV